MCGQSLPGRTPRQGCCKRESWSVAAVADTVDITKHCVEREGVCLAGGGDWPVVCRGLPPTSLLFSDVVHGVRHGGLATHRPHQQHAGLMVTLRDQVFSASRTEGIRQRCVRGHGLKQWQKRGQGRNQGRVKCPGRGRVMVCSGGSRCVTRPTSMALQAGTPV